VDRIVAGVETAVIERDPVDAVRLIVANSMLERELVARIPARAPGAEERRRWKIDYAGRKQIIRHRSSEKQITALAAARASRT
jgi:hypothetical protein